jgi:hypothetical protein
LFVIFRAPSPPRAERLPLTKKSLSRIAALAGTGSEEYRSLAAVLEKSPGTGLVY